MRLNIALEIPGHQRPGRRDQEEDAGQPEQRAERENRGNQQREKAQQVQRDIVAVAFRIEEFDGLKKHQQIDKSKRRLPPNHQRIHDAKHEKRQRDQIPKPRRKRMAQPAGIDLPAERQQRRKQQGGQDTVFIRHQQRGET